MTAIITRTGKGSALDHSEMDSNLDSQSGINEAQTGTTYTVIAADQNRTIEINNSSDVAVTLTLISTILTAIDTTDYKVFIKNIGTGIVTITPTTDTFDDGDTEKQLFQYGAIEIQTDSTEGKWNVLNKKNGALVKAGTGADTSITISALNGKAYDAEMSLISDDGGTVVFSFEINGDTIATNYFIDNSISTVTNTNTFSAQSGVNIAEIKCRIYVNSNNKLIMEGTDGRFVSIFSINNFMIYNTASITSITSIKVLASSGNLTTSSYIKITEVD